MNFINCEGSDIFLIIFCHKYSFKDTIYFRLKVRINQKKSLLII